MTQLEGAASQLRHVGGWVFPEKKVLKKNVNYLKSCVKYEV